LVGATCVRRSKDGIDWTDFCRIIEKGITQNATAAQMFERLDIKGARLGGSRARAACRAAVRRAQAALVCHVRGAPLTTRAPWTLGVHTGTGQLSPDVLRAALQRYGCDASDAAIDKMIRWIDVDGDGQVSLQEFAAVHAVQNPNQDQQL
jgi:hypothetical protein